MAEAILLFMMALIGAIVFCALTAWAQAEPGVLEVTRDMGCLGSGGLLLFFIFLVSTMRNVHSRNVAEGRAKASTAFEHGALDVAQKGGSCLWVLILLVIVITGISIIVIELPRV